MPDNKYRLELLVWTETNNFRLISNNYEAKEFDFMAKNKKKAVVKAKEILADAQKNFDGIDRAELFLSVETLLDKTLN